MTTEDTLTTHIATGRDGPIGLCGVVWPYRLMTAKEYITIDLRGKWPPYQVCNTCMEILPVVLIGL